MKSKQLRTIQSRANDFVVGDDPKLPPPHTCILIGRTSSCVEKHARRIGGHWDSVAVLHFHEIDATVAVLDAAVWRVPPLSTFGDVTDRDWLLFERPNRWVEVEQQ
jgi:hypothetical protein